MNDGSERPIAFASRPRTEKGNAQIDKEALAIIWESTNSMCICLGDLSSSIHRRVFQLQQPDFSNRPYFKLTMTTKSRTKTLKCIAVQVVFPGCH